ncbi:TrmH family RNA methyltransferase [Marinospirillum sp.]|uniref:TrmH family RNA methyltransferase n=1 Tax=Marinospirillum sp. TaxID=2183934 RepID=UPI003A882F1B
MISKNQLKFLRSLHQKKGRLEQQAFLVEGEKSVVELLHANWKILSLYASEEFINRHTQRLEHLDCPLYPASAASLTQASTLSNNHTALAVVAFPAPPPVKTTGWTLALDQINDPGNLGTLLRIADWYGFQQLICSPGTAELTNPKVISASKGSFLRMPLHVCPLEDFLSQLTPQVPVLGAFLEGESIHQLTPDQLGESGVLLLGNEAQGIRPSLQAWVNCRVTIPAFGQAESLNVGVAGAILCDNIQRLRALKSSG